VAIIEMPAYLTQYISDILLTKYATSIAGEQRKGEFREESASKACK